MKRRARAKLGASRVPLLAGFTSAVALAVVGVGGCGDSAPTTVSAADLQEGREYWLSLDAPLRRELATICHNKQVKEESDPELVLSLQDIDVDDYVALITREYEEQGDASTSDIEEACEEAQQELAREEFEQLVPHLRQGG